MEWWSWAIAGVVLLGMELFVPVDFYVFFLGVAALGVGLATAVGLTDTFTAQLVVFSVLAVVATFGLRGPIVARLRRGPDLGVGVETLVGELVRLTTALPANGIGKGELRGTTWSVRSADATALEEGRRCRVERVDGLVLWVRPE